MHTQEKRVALTTNSKLILQAKRQNQQHAEEVTSCSLTYFCNSTGSKIDTWKTRGPVFMPVLPVKDHSPTMGLDPGGICRLQSVLLTALSKVIISLQFDFAKLEGKFFFHKPISQNKKQCLNS